MTIDNNNIGAENTYDEGYEVPEHLQQIERERNYETVWKMILPRIRNCLFNMGFEGGYLKDPLAAMGGKSGILKLSRLDESSGLVTLKLNGVEVSIEQFVQNHDGVIALRSAPSSSETNPHRRACITAEIEDHKREIARLSKHGMQSLIIKDIADRRRAIRALEAQLNSKGEPTPRSVQKSSPIPSNVESEVRQIELEIEQRKRQPPTVPNLAEVSKLKRRKQELLNRIHAARGA